MEPASNDESLREACLKPSWFCDSDHPAIVSHAAEVCRGAEDDREKAVRLFRAVREAPRYDPYTVSRSAADHRASAVLAQESAYCIPKAVLLCALLRAEGIPARLGFADVKNHLATDKLLRTLGSDEFAWHGFVELWLGERSFKVTPAFNASLCARFGVPPLDFDGERDALLQPFDGAGRPYMDYLRDRGRYLDVPFDTIMTDFRDIYGVGAYVPSADADVHDAAFHPNDARDVSTR